MLLVHDAVLPVCYRIRPRDVTVVKRSILDEKEPVRQFRERVFQAARRVAERKQRFGAGKLFSLPVADGLAWYVVTKVTPKSGQPPRVGSLYVQKWALGENPPRRLTVTLETTSGTDADQRKGS